MTITLGSLTTTEGLDSILTEMSSGVFFPCGLYLYLNTEPFKKLVNKEINMMRS